MTTLDHRLFEQFSTEDTTSVGWTLVEGTRAPSLDHRLALAGHSRLHHVDSSVVLLFMASWFKDEERSWPNRRFEEVATDVTSWEMRDETQAGLIGVVAPQRKRRELFRMTMDITPGRLPHRQHRFAFLDGPEPEDDD